MTEGTRGEGVINHVTCNPATWKNENLKLEAG